MGIIAIIVWTSNWLVNTGGETYDVPNLIRNEMDDPDRTIYFSDIVKFDMVSISNAHKSHEIFLGNSDTGEEYIFWRLVPVGWFNRSLTWSKNVVVAIVSPSYEIEQMDSYRHAMFITPHPTIPNAYITIDSSEINSNNYNDSTFDIHGIVFGNTLHPLEVGQSFTKEEVLSNGRFKDMLINRDYIDFKFKNEVIKFEKYNSEEYDQFQKFLVNKPVAKWAFAEMIIIFSLTLFVVYQNPIDFTRNERGVTEIDRTFLPRIPLPKRRERKYRNKDDYGRGRRRR
jgi:hypothetical protein